MNKQEMFNAAYIGIIKQGGASVIQGSCAYRSENGRKCAAGWLITNEELTKVRKRGAEDEYAVNTVGIGALTGLPSHFDGNKIFIRELQRAHDNSYFDSKGSDDAFLSLFKDRMANVARNYNLTIPEIPSDDLSQTNS